jgi:hypothetical protein
MPYVLYVQFSPDGVVREAFKMKDYSAEPRAAKASRAENAGKTQDVRRRLSGFYA